MIRFVRGQFAAADADGVVVCMGGMGFHVRVSNTTRAQLPGIGSEIMLKTHLVVREDALDLYGFGDDEERLIFEALLGVNGIGPRSALAICGLGTPQMLAVAIGNGETAYLSRAAGVGRKTAERILLELRDRVGIGGGTTAAPGSPRGRAKQGLLTLGFSGDEVDSALTGADDGLDEEGLIRHGLAALGR
ncbi:MAG: Holliday junction branch migration protein RuvA [Thermoleophilia bacterium]|nr:Holliday junction branch migration protein RuvA [Thermoleophilia bacterium]